MAEKHRHLLLFWVPQCIEYIPYSSSHSTVLLFSFPLRTSDYHNKIHSCLCMLNKPLLSKWHLTAPAAIKNELNMFDLTLVWFGSTSLGPVQVLSTIYSIWIHHMINFVKSQNTILIQKHFFLFSVSRSMLWVYSCKIRICMDPYQYGCPGPELEMRTTYQTVIETKKHLKYLF